MPPWWMLSCHPLERFLRQKPRDGASAEVWASHSECRSIRQGNPGTSQKKNENNPLSQNEDSSPERYFFRHYHFQKHFSYQNNPPTFPKDSASCSCVSPQEAVEVFQLFGKKKIILFSQVLARGSWTALKATKKNPLKLFCKCSQAFLQAFLSNVFSNLKFSLYCCK